MRWIVSAKGVVTDQTRVLLARNDRQEWELLGGQLELSGIPLPDGYRTVIDNWFSMSGHI